MNVGWRRLTNPNSPQRVEHFILFPESLGPDVGVDLGRTDIHMVQEFLDITEPRASLNHVGGCGVADIIGGEVPVVDSGSLGCTADHLTKGFRRDAARATVTGSPSPPRATNKNEGAGHIPEELRAPPREPVLEGVKAGMR